jgi:hypothetical protein
MAMLMVGNKMWKVMLAANCNRANKSGSRASMVISFEGFCGAVLSCAVLTWLRAE